MWLRGALLVLAFTVASCGGAGAPGDGSARVVASVYPLAFVAERIGGDAADVADLTPPGQESHDIELTAEQIKEVSGADLLLYVGGGYQPALEDVVGDATGETIDALAEVDVVEAGGVPDPHFWLDPHRLQDVARVAASNLTEINPEEAETYEQNARDLQDELDELDSDYREGLQDCARGELVTAHEAFGYLADRYDLEQVGIAGIDPEGEPSPQRLVEVADFVAEHDVTTIFFEELVSPAVAETLASETGAGTASLNPLESRPDDGDYITAMRENLVALQKALGCN